MTIPDDLDDAYELFNKKSVELNAALDAVEADQAAGRSGYEPYLNAQRLADDVKEFARVLAARIEEARRTL